jgi:acetate kinase
VRRAAAIADRPLGELRVVCCHLGAGASLCAVRGGRSVDTTMGFTPLAGLVMQTRTGSVDPGLVLWLLEHATRPDHARAGPRAPVGSQGAVGNLGDYRDVVAAHEAGRLRQHSRSTSMSIGWSARCGAMVASAGGLDLLVFTGGVGEHAPADPAAAAERLS